MVKVKTNKGWRLIPKEQFDKEYAPIVREIKDEDEAGGTNAGGFI